MSTTIDTLPKQDDEKIDEDVDNILNNLQKEYDTPFNEDDDNNLNQEYINQINNNYEQDFHVENQNKVVNTENNNQLNSLFDNIINNCRQPLIVLIVVIIINNNFTLSFLKNIPQLASDGILNMVGYIAVAIIIALTFFILNIVSTQML